MTHRLYVYRYTYKGRANHRFYRQSSTINHKHNDRLKQKQKQLVIEYDG